MYLKEFLGIEASIGVKASELKNLDYVYGYYSTSKTIEEGWG